MKKILGIDLGTTSIGWALVEEGKQLIDGGVIIFPRGNNLDPKTGKEASFSQQRTAYRGMRRRLFRRKLRRDRLLKLFMEWYSLSREMIHDNTKPEELYRIRAHALNPNSPITLPELCRVFLYFSKKRGFKSNRKQAARDGDETGVVKEGIAELNQTLEAEGFRTIGEFFYSLIKNHKDGLDLDKRILGRWTSREMYLKEFNLICEVQRQKFPIELSEDKIERIRKEIFFQRPLKSAKHLIASCRFEPQKKVMPRSHPIFQEFRLWQMLNNVSWVNPDTGEYGELSLDQMASVAKLYNEKVKPTETQFKKAAGLSSRVILKDISLKSCSTLIGIREALGSNINNLSEPDILNIYHALLYSHDDNYEKFALSIKSRFNIPEEKASKLWSLALEPDYSGISHKAAVKMLPFLKEGKMYHEAALEAGYHHSSKNTFKNLDQIPPLATNEMRNPVVQKAVSQCINLVNTIIKTHGKPDEVVVELARELKKPKEIREKERLRNRNVEKKREEFAAVLSRHRGSSIATWDSLITKYELWLELGCEDESLRAFDGFADRIKSGDVEKFQLWLEAGRISPYTGQVINISQLFSPEIEIEHIVPFSRSLDNSRLNKTLCERRFNHDKTNCTPLEFFEKKDPRAYDDFIKRIALIPNKAKREQFLKKGADADYLNSQISDTAIIARRVMEKLGTAIEKVRCSKGRLTSLLSKEWGLRNIYDYEGLDDAQRIEVKNRGDHRHHFVDACVLACITQSIVQKVAKAQLGNYGKLDGLDIPDPFPAFRSLVYDKVNSILIVHRMRKRLSTLSQNKFKHSASKSHVQRMKAIRGTLHEDTLYGKILDAEGKERYVTRKNVIDLSFDQINKIVDGGIRRYLLELASQNPGGWQEVIRKPILFEGKPLRKVRWVAPDSYMPLLRSDTKTFAAPGNNLLMVIYEGENGKRDYKTISYYEAVQSSRNQLPIYSPELNGKKLLFTLSPYDKLLWCEHPDEIDFENYEELQSRLYYVMKFTGPSIYLGQAHLANIKANYDKRPVKIFCTYNTLRGIKVKLDLLGKIVWRSDQQ